MYYYLTGYRRSLDVLLMAGRQEADHCNFGTNRVHRGTIVTGHNQFDLYRVTWDDRFWKNAFKAHGDMLDHFLSRDPVSGSGVDEYDYEFLYDIDEFSGDSRLKGAVLTRVDPTLPNNVKGRQWAFLFIF